jgi:hypothetical protein
MTILSSACDSLLSTVNCFSPARLSPVSVVASVRGAHRPRHDRFFAVFGKKVQRMAGFWTPWRLFPDSLRGDLIQAPISPGVYEVRRISNGEVVAFGPSANVARDLSAFRPQPSRLPWARPFEQEEAARASEFEYRTCAAATVNEARDMARHLLGRREIFLKRHSAWRKIAPGTRPSSSAFGRLV